MLTRNFVNFKSIIMSFRLIFHQFKENFRSNRGGRRDYEQLLRSNRNADKNYGSQAPTRLTREAKKDNLVLEKEKLE